MIVNSPTQVKKYLRKISFILAQRFEKSVSFLGVRSSPAGVRLPHRQVLLDGVGPRPRRRNPHPAEQEHDHPVRRNPIKTNSRNLSVVTGAWSTFGRILNCPNVTNSFCKLCPKNKYCPRYNNLNSESLKFEQISRPPL